MNHRKYIFFFISRDQSQFILYTLSFRFLVQCQSAVVTLLLVIQ